MEHLDRNLSKAELISLIENDLKQLEKINTDIEITVCFYADGIKEKNRLHKFTVTQYDYAQDIIISYICKGFKIRAGWYNITYHISGEMTKQRLIISTYYALVNDMSNSEREGYKKLKWYFTNTSPN